MKKKETVPLRDIYDVCDALNDHEELIWVNRRAIKNLRRSCLWTSLGLIIVGVLGYATSKEIEDLKKQLRENAKTTAEGIGAAKELLMDDDKRILRLEEELEGLKSKE
jgi:hypothetical protein